MQPVCERGYKNSYMYFSTEYKNRSIKIAIRTVPITTVIETITAVAVRFVGTVHMGTEYTC